LIRNPGNIKGVTISRDISKDILHAISRINPDKVVFLFEDNTNRFCRPLLDGAELTGNGGILVLESGENNKNLEQVTRVWDFLEQVGATRKSLLITVGGGMLTDLGGFAACTFKRGMAFMNIPTSLLAMVDASVGGKTGINYRGLKNEIGIIRQPENVFIHVPFLKTLDKENFISGFAEMLKAGLILDKSLWDKLCIFPIQDPDLEGLEALIWRSVHIKNSVVEKDPDEENERRSLNLGHTSAHAFESLSLKRNAHLHHGYAVAYGIVAETYFSEELTGLPSEQAQEIREVLKSVYGEIPFSKSDIPELVEFMRSDKKNDNVSINFTLLETIGKYRINNYIKPEKVADVLAGTLKS
jgi:3-dehydroquinate synthase